MQASDFVTISPAFGFREFFPETALPWEWIPAIGSALEGFDPEVWPDRMIDYPEGFNVTGSVFVHRSVRLPSYGVIEGPAWIGPECELRPGVYIRGKVIVEGGAVLGNSCEFKNSLILAGAQVPHFSYVGDSVLGRKAHLGAGAILSNLRFDQQRIVVRDGGERWETGLRKFGAILGDGAEVGCNAVLQPGTILGREALVAPGCAVGGVFAERTLTFVRPGIRTVCRPE